MKIQNKRGWIRIVEAGLAMFLLLGFIFIMTSKQVEEPDIAGNAYKMGRMILEEVADNETIRKAVLEENKAPIEEFIGSRLVPEGLWDFGINITGVEDSPNYPDNVPLEVEVYVEDIVISSTLEEYSPKKLVLFIWIES